MPSLFQTFLLGLVGACSVRGHVHSNSTVHLGQNYRIDVHSHVVPQIWKDAMIEAGYPVQNGSLYADGFPVPDWTLKDHIATMDSLGVNYSTISISAPGVYFIQDATKAHTLARKINQEMHNYTRQHPRRLGAMCLLPLPHVEESLAEIEVYIISQPCMIQTNFDSTASTPSTLSVSPPSPTQPASTSATTRSTLSSPPSTLATAPCSSTRQHQAATPSRWITQFH